MSYYRNNISNAYVAKIAANTFYHAGLVTNIYQGNISYPFDEVRRLTLIAGIRQDKFTVKAARVDSSTGIIIVPDDIGLTQKDRTDYNIMGRVEYVHDNTLNPTTNIWEGLRWKTYLDFAFPGAKGKFIPNQELFNFGIDARHYLPIYRHCIWAVRFAADVSWGSRKVVYYLGGADGDLLLNSDKFNQNNKPAADNIA